MSDVLTKIVDVTRNDLVSAKSSHRSFHEAAETIRRSRTPHSFRDAIRSPGNPRIIAEIKAASPSAGDIAPEPDVEAIARAYRDGGAAAISVVVEPHFFKGDREWMQRASDAAALPVIMKDFVVDPFQIDRGVASGADAILLLASLLDAATMREFRARIEAYGCDALVEVHDERELDVALEAEASIIGVNNRDLRDFSVSLETSERLVRRIPPECIRVAESGIRTEADVRRLMSAGFDAFLVGESLLRQSDRRAAVRRLRNACDEVPG